MTGQSQVKKFEFPILKYNIVPANENKC